MSNVDSGMDLCPICGRAFRIEELNAHANSHFASGTASPVQLPTETTAFGDLTADIAPPGIENNAKMDKRRMEMGFLPTVPSHLKEVQTVEGQFEAGLNSLDPLERAYTSGRPPENGHSILCVSGSLKCIKPFSMMERCRPNAALLHISRG